MKLKNRMTEDTRSKLYELYLYEMKDHLVFGKGMDGVYFFPMARSEVEEGVVFDEVVYRNVIENGYLQLLLTGGIIHIILFLLVLIPAAFLGIFKSSNQLSVASGALILLWMVDMLIYGLPTLNLHYIVVWICVGICYKSSIRDASNEEIREQFLFLR
jgi:O-antigen ligase